MNTNMKTRIVRLEQIVRPSSSKCERRGRFNMIQPNAGYVRQTLCHPVLVPHLQKPVCFCSGHRGVRVAWIGWDQLFTWTLGGGILNSERWFPKPVRLLEVRLRGGP